MTTWQTGCTHYWSLSQSLNILALVSAEGLAHSVSGAGVGEPQSGAGYQKQTAPPAGEEDDGAWQTGETRGEWKYSLGNKTSDATEKKKRLIYFSFQKDKNVMLDESLKKVQQENEDLKARMDRHAALSR